MLAAQGRKCGTKTLSNMGEIKLIIERKASGEGENEDEGEEQGSGKQGKTIKDEGKKRNV